MKSTRQFLERSRSFLRRIRPVRTGLVALALIAMAGCDDAQVANYNMTRAADNFEVARRIIFYNGITNQYMLTIEGRCALADQMSQLEVLCKTAPGIYKKHFLGLSDNVTYFAEHLGGTKLSAYHYRITFKPQVILPDVDFRGSASELIENTSESNQ